MKRNKSGISLIVLVITVIVMIILAGSVIISLSNSGIIGKANEAVDANNLKQVQQLAALAWSEAYIDKMQGEEVDLEDEVIKALDNNNVSKDKYIINVTDNGVEVLAKTLGNLITSAEDYGKYVDYTVTVDGIEYKDWQVYYEDEKNGYVYIVTTNSVEEVSLDERITVASLSAAENSLYEKFRVGKWQKYTLVDELNGETMYNCQAVAQLIRNYSNYANKTTYGEYVIGAIGGPTIELLAAGWNAKGYKPKITVGTGEYGYTINDAYYLYTGKCDGLYILSDYYYWLSSPSIDIDDYGMGAGYDYVDFDDYGNTRSVRPVVCLSSNIPAYEGEGGDFSLVKQGE